MAEPTYPKLSPEDIELRVKPRRVARINRKVLIGSVAVGALLLFGAFLFALNPPDWRGKQANQELYNTDRKAIADGLSKWFPRNDLDAESFAMSVLFGNGSEDSSPRKIGADAWFDRREAERFEVHEQTIRTGYDEILTLILISDLAMLDH